MLGKSLWDQFHASTQSLNPEIILGSVFRIHGVDYLSDLFYSWLIGQMDLGISWFQKRPLSGTLMRALIL